MQMFSYAAAALVALGIIGIGAMYLVAPRTATKSFGLPLPEAGANVAWWLRLKGIRDVVSGLMLGALMLRSTPSVVGIALLVYALIPLGDMSAILSARGSVGRALGIHGVTAAMMIVAALPLLISAM